MPALALVDDLPAHFHRPYAGVGVNRVNVVNAVMGAENVVHPVQGFQPVKNDIPVPVKASLAFRVTQHHGYRVKRPHDVSLMTLVPRGAGGESQRQ